MQGFLRACANPDVVREVRPADRAAGIDQKFRWSRDVVPVLAAFGMQHAVVADNIGVRVREKREGIAARVAEFSRLAWGIDANSRNFNPAGMKFVQVLLETP